MNVSNLFKTFVFRKLMSTESPVVAHGLSVYGDLGNTLVFTGSQEKTSIACHNLLGSLGKWNLHGSFAYI